MPKLVFTIGNLLLTSGVARLGYTGAHALATRGCAPPVQVCISADSINVDHESGAKRSSNRMAQYHYIYPQDYESRMRMFAIYYIKVTYTALQCGLRTDLGGCKVSGRACPRPP